MHKLRENAKEELREIEEKGLSKTNIDNAYKLVEIMKGIDKIDMMQEGGEYSRDRYSRDMEDYSRDDYSRDDYSRDDYDNGNSYRRGRNQRTGRYMHRPNSRLSGDDTDMERYKEMKRQYSNARDGESKNRMLDALDELMCGIKGMVKQICRDSDCAEERNIVMKHVHEMADMY